MMNTVLSSDCHKSPGVPENVSQSSDGSREAYKEVRKGQFGCNSVDMAQDGRMNVWFPLAGNHVSRLHRGFILYCNVEMEIGRR